MFLSEFAPLEFLFGEEHPGVLSIIIDRTGPGYRSIGAMMAFSHDGKKIGSLSSGCIEDDLWLTAKNALKANLPIISYYGSSTKNIDLRLPCGGKMEILSIPNPDRKILNKILSQLADRKEVGISANLLNGKISVADSYHSTLDEETFKFNLKPELKLIVMGAGVETQAFCLLSKAANIKITLLTPDQFLLEDKSLSVCEKYHLKSSNDFPKLEIDQWTAIVLFFHDHDWEPPLLHSVLGSDAFYIGAQGSKSAHIKLINDLKVIGSSEKELSNLKSQIGLIPSARDPKTLAVSVLADILKYFHLNK